MTLTEKTNKADQRVAMRWIPKDSRKIEHALGVCYVADRVNGPQNEPWKQRQVFEVIGYIGTAGKSAFYESYRTAEARDERVRSFFAGLESSAKMLAERKAERANKAEGKSVLFRHGSGSLWEGKSHYCSWYA